MYDSERYALCKCIGYIRDSHYSRYGTLNNTGINVLIQWIMDKDDDQVKQLYDRIPEQIKPVVKELINYYYNDSVI